MFLFYVLSFFKKGDTIQGGTLVKGGHYLRKYGIYFLNFLNCLLAEQTNPGSKITVVLVIKLKQVPSYLNTKAWWLKWKKILTKNHPHPQNPPQNPGQKNQPQKYNTSMKCQQKPPPNFSFTVFKVNQKNCKCTQSLDIIKIFKLNPKTALF